MTSSPTGSHERVNQKARTRRALLQAARELMAAGGDPTVADVADAAAVSRATAYRYFPSQGALLGESALFVSLGDERLLSPEAVFGGPKAPTDVEDRIALVSDTMYDVIRTREVAFRRFLPIQIARGLEDSPSRRPMRPGYRVAMIDAALAPVADEFTARESRRLKDALGVLIGPEALIAMRDVLQVEHDLARRELAWACRALVRAARAEAAERRATASRSRTGGVPGSR